MESTNGTFVNNECIGRSGVESWGHLLNDGDVIWIKPHWRYRFRQLSTPGVNAMIRRSGDLRVCLPHLS
jgi:pSer/pThr/pTyr-binding forkhead associated (FHA) protein